VCARAFARKRERGSGRGVRGKSVGELWKKGGRDGRKRDEGARGRGKAAERGRFYRRNQGQRAKDKAMPPLVSSALRYATPLRQVYGRRCTDVLSSLTAYQPSPFSSPRPFLPAAFRHFISLGIFSLEQYRLPEAVTRDRCRLDSAYPTNRRLDTSNRIERRAIAAREIPTRLSRRRAESSFDELTASESNRSRFLCRKQIIRRPERPCQSRTRLLEYADEGGTVTSFGFLASRTT